VNPRSLRVIHLLKEAAVSTGAPSYRSAPENALFLDSCQRWLWIERVPRSELENPRSGLPGEVFYGSDAYAFLLLVATGLESQILGETDIFGQLKQAWTKQKDLLNPALKKDLSAWMRRLFEDTKEIRSRYLQNIGGSSYGSLIRKLLKDNGSLSVGPTLLIGAGQLARSVAPYLLDHELWIFNRTPGRAQKLALDLVEENPSARIRALGRSNDEELSAISLAAQLVICVPGDPARDRLRLQALREAGCRAQVVHMGIRGVGEASAGAWAEYGRFFSLENLFQIDRSLSAVRSLQVQRARAACREKAILRELDGGPASIAHGWEDLAAFG